MVEEITVEVGTLKGSRPQASNTPYRRRYSGTRQANFNGATYFVSIFHTLDKPQQKCITTGTLIIRVDCKLRVYVSPRSTSTLARFPLIEISRIKSTVVSRGTFHLVNKCKYQKETEESVISALDFFFFFFFFVSLLSYTSNDTTILAGEKTYRINSILPIVIDKFLPRAKLNFLRLGISMVVSNV